MKLQSQKAELVATSISQQYGNVQQIAIPMTTAASQTDHSQFFESSPVESYSGNGQDFATHMKGEQLLQENGSLEVKEKAVTTELLTCEMGNPEKQGENLYQLSSLHDEIQKLQMQLLTLKESKQSLEEKVTELTTLPASRYEKLEETDRRDGEQGHDKQVLLEELLQSKNEKDMMEEEKERIKGELEELRLLERQEKQQRAVATEELTRLQIANCRMEEEKGSMQALVIKMMGLLSDSCSGGFSDDSGNGQSRRSLLQKCKEMAAGVESLVRRNGELSQQIRQLEAANRELEGNLEKQQEGLTARETEIVELETKLRFFVCNKNLPEDSHSITSAGSDSVPDRMKMDTDVNEKLPEYGLELDAAFEATEIGKDGQTSDANLPAEGEHTCEATSRGTAQEENGSAEVKEQFKIDESKCTIQQESKHVSADKDIAPDTCDELQFTQEVPHVREGLSLILKTLNAITREGTNRDVVESCGGGNEENKAEENELQKREDNVDTAAGMETDMIDEIINQVAYLNDVNQKLKLRSKELSVDCATQDDIIKMQEYDIEAKAKRIDQLQQEKEKLKLKVEKLLQATSQKQQIIDALEGELTDKTREADSQNKKVCASLQAHIQ